MREHMPDLAYGGLGHIKMGPDEPCGYSDASGGAATGTNAVSEVRRTALSRRAASAYQGSF
jgi:hypothetical protein